MKLRTVGFPCTRHEAAEVREFLPPLFAFLKQFGLERVVVEDGYGARMGIPQASYHEALPGLLQHGSRELAFTQDLVVILRCPAEADLRRLRPGSVLISMLHFPTRPQRVALLESLQVTGVAMDQVADDLGRRLIENLQAVAFNGLRVGMQTLAATWPPFKSRQRPLRVTVLGAGAVGAHAVRAAVRYADDAVRAQLREAGVPGVAVTVLDVELTSDAAFLEDTLRQTDLLVDATQRADPSVPVVRNEQLDRLPAHAVIVDLSVDPNDFTRTPPAVSALEGVPQGTLDQYVFQVSDPAWDALDARVPHRVRRAVVSCYSWPGIQPLDCMNVYGKQLEPVLRALIERGTALPTEGGAWAERATGRALHRHWLPRADRLIRAAGGGLFTEVTDKAINR